MPSETPDERSRQRVKRPDEKRIEERAFQSAVQSRFHRKAFLDDSNLTKFPQQLPELTRTVLQQNRSVVMLQWDLHQFRQRIQPRDAVIHLKHRLATGLQNSAAFVDKLLRVRGVLDDAVGIYQIEGRVGKRELFAVCFAKIGLQFLLFEILLRESNRRRRQIDAGHDGSATGKSHEIGAGAATHFEHLTAGVAVEVHQTKQVMKFFEMVLLEIGEESWRADWMFGDLQIVNVTVPVLSNVVF